jgi:hypothetical protein
LGGVIEGPVRALGGFRETVGETRPALFDVSD